MVKLLIAISVCVAFVFGGNQAQAQETGETLNTRIGKLSFTHDFANGYPSHETRKKLFNEMDFQRATTVLHLLVISLYAPKGILHGQCSVWKASPTGRQVNKKTSISDCLVELPKVGGLHHRYEWRTAA